MQKTQFIHLPSLEKLSLAMSAERFDRFKQVALSSLNDLADELNQALANQDIEQLHRSAHSIKSSAHYMGGLSISEQARLLEQQFKNQDMVDAEQAVATLQADLKDFMIELEHYSPEHSPDKAS
ncbi:Hpt domain-containing protein [Sinobacterium caligoides]|uniref:Hpt domain-containing protein n=1 Tax=Sinobacterium caligoides TaxID=933926 RepID=UPI000F4CEA6A|nr:Hpt domain-containing protein [Sinobacterium caligoides]